MACRAKHRLQPCEPKSRPAEARKTRPAGFGTNPSATCESCVCKSTLLLNRANAACGSEPGDSRSDDPPCRETAARATLQVAKKISKKNDCKQRNSTNCKKRRTTETGAKPAPKTTIPITQPRHYAASGLLNLQTTLTKAVAPVTPGVKLPLQR